jgi:hypothetical protein
MKQFEATWGEGYVKPQTLTIGLDMITEEYGWFEEYIQMIDALELGQVADCSDYSGVLFVKRIA